MKDNTEQITENASADFFKELGEFMAPYKGKYILSIILSILGVTCEIMAYIFAGHLIKDIFLQQKSYKAIIVWTVYILLAKILNTICVYVSTWISHHAAYETLKDIRLAVTDKMLRIPLGYFETLGSGRIRTMIVDQIEGMEVTLAHLFPELTGNILVPIVLFVVMFIRDWRLALAATLWIIISLTLSCGMMIGYEKKYTGQIKALKNMNQAIVEYVGGISEIKTFNKVDSSVKKYEKAVNDHANYDYNWVKETGIFSSIALGIMPYSLFPVLYIGLKFANIGTLAVSDFLFIIIAVLGIYNPLMRAAGFFDQIAQMGTAAKEIRTILDYKEIERSKNSILSKNGSVEFENVSFGYEGSKEDVLENVSIYVPEGSMLALVGPSGSGKSTLGKLLAGYWDPTNGNIKVGENPMKNYSSKELSKMVAYVDQETFLFDMSIKENIRIGKPDATDQEVIDAAKAAGCDEFIKKFENGYDTSVGEAGNRLSGGEKQRVAIARAIIKDAPVLILDEATASTDPENESAIQEALSIAAKDKTLIVIAHRLKTIVDAEQIAFIKDGKILDSGTHEELLERCKDYQKLWLLSCEEGENA